jgi:hypothetical protein
LPVSHVPVLDLRVRPYFLARLSAPFWGNGKSPAGSGRPTPLHPEEHTVIPDNDRSSAALPANPITELAGMAAVHHELFVSYVNAGFTPAQALELLKAVIAQAGRNAGQ